MDLAQVATIQFVFKRLHLFSTAKTNLSRQPFAIISAVINLTYFLTIIWSIQPWFCHQVIRNKNGCNTMNGEPTIIAIVISIVTSNYICVWEWHNARPEQIKFLRNLHSKLVHFSRQIDHLIFHEWHPFLLYDFVLFDDRINLRIYLTSHFVLLATERTARTTAIRATDRQRSPTTRTEPRVDLCAPVLMN